LPKNELLRPFLKWAGGKRQLLPELRRYLPRQLRRYFEPFLGGGAVLFHLQPKWAVVNDINEELINTYRVIQNNVEGLVAALSQHLNEREYYYRLRDLDRSERFSELTDVERAARIIYLNKTCYNGLFRVNSQGQFNVPFGDYKNPKIVDEVVLRAVSYYLNSNDITFLQVDFEEALREAGKGDFVYLDPPYDPVSNTASFTGYNLDGFGRDEQIRLKAVVDDLTRRHCRVLLSNSATDFITDLYRDYTVVVTGATRVINSDATRRGKVDEVLVLNYEP
jgi:DNA adenine methylase